MLCKLTSYFSKVLLFHVFFPLVIHAQQEVTLRGTVIDSATQSPVEFATAGIYKVSNPVQPLKIIATGSRGLFEIKKLSAGKYTLIITHTSYREMEINIIIDSTQTSIDAGKILINRKSSELQNVTVKGAARKPLVEVEDDKMIYNAKEDPSNQSLTVIDLLRKTPLVSVDGEDNVQLNGQTNFRVLLNGRETAIFTRDPKSVLKGFPANLIEKIEVITNPPAKYDGEGVGGLINIVTTKKLLGYNGNLGVTHDRINTTAFGAINLKLGKFGFSSFGGYNGGTNPRAQSYNEFITLNPVAYSKRLSNGFMMASYFDYWGNAELAWEPDSLNTFSIYANLNAGGGDNTTQTNFDLILPSGTDTLKSFFESLVTTNRPSFGSGMDYIYRFKKNKEKEISIRFFHEKGKDIFNDTSYQSSTYGTRFILNDNLAENLQSTFQADFIQPLKKKHKLEFGAKAILRRATADYKNYFRTNATEDYKLVPDNSDFFDYRQNVYSLYSTYRFTWKKISFRLGLRMEQTDIKGNFENTGTSVNQQYNSFLPNIFFSKKIKTSTSTATLSYTRRLTRPFIWHLNPFIKNVDSLNVSTGNPLLQPEYSHNMEAGYTVITKVSSLSFRLSKLLSNTRILDFISFDKNNGVRSKAPGNIGIISATGLVLSFTSRFTKSWTFIAGLRGEYLSLKNKQDKSQKNKGFNGIATVSSNYIITKKITVSSTLGAILNPVTLQGRTSNHYWYNTQFIYKMFDGKLSMSVNANSFLNKYFPIWQSWIAGADFTSYSKINYVRRRFGASIRWNFGKLTENVSKKKGVINDDLKRKDE